MITDPNKPYEGWHWSFIEDWSQFFEKCNWYTFRVAFIELENDKIMGGVEMTFVLFGLGFRVRWNYTENEKVKEIKQAAQEFAKEHDLE